MDPGRDGPPGGPPEEATAGSIAEAHATLVVDPATTEVITPDLPPASEVAPDPTDPLVSSGPRGIIASQILSDRPDVLQGFYRAYYGPGNDPSSSAWAERVGGDTPEAYARYWYDHHGRYEGYAQGSITAGDNVSLERILQERPDVLRGFYEAFYGPDNDRNSGAWAERVGGETPEAYAKYWYEKYGKWEGYGQTEKAAAENINCERLLEERPDVFRAFFTEYYGPSNDRHSSAWVDRVGGDTVQDYAKYWYTAYGRREGYTQQAPEVADGSAPTEPSPNEIPTEDPSLDPWNHPALYPEWTPPFPGWRPPGAEPAASVEESEAQVQVGGTLMEGLVFG